MDNETVSEWFELYGDDVFHFLIYRIGPSDAEDLLQEVFIKALKGFSRYKGNASPKTWLFSIARNVAIDESRKRKSNKWMDTVPYDDMNEPSTDLTPEVILSANEETKCIVDCIQSLKPNYQDVIILRGIKELSVKETAAILKWSENKVKITHHRARIALNDQLRRCKDDEQTRSSQRA
ncbi:RNA polymerase sigma factor [Ornithinibacillus halophilus]|uniref:RNA polymerase sigma factor n=1 Tax=Ornithinibacillus halophilus TaxID=930117 RepID=A0A1M5KRF4_9BACI|nr:RNA polymerase sigma factor [Ornithinibacillus halophilus]SHG55099.1 RNA polymerase, sigma subunit, SigX [Ornithinibacillus halophilus]